VAESRTEWMTRMIETWNAGNYEGFLDELGPDVEFSPDPSFPDAGTYRGEEFHRWMRDWISTWQENRFEMLEMNEVEQALVVRGRWHLAAKGTGDEVPLADFSIVLRYAGPAAQRPHRVAIFFDHERAMEVARGTG
jgi:hypothetical protein